MSGDEAAREAEDFLKGLREPDLTYRDPIYVDCVTGPEEEWVAVAAWGAADELLANDEPEIAPIRLRLHEADQDEAEVYMTTREAEDLIAALRVVIDRAASFPQPPAPEETTDA